MADTESLQSSFSPASPDVEPASEARIAEQIYPANGGEIFLGFVSPVGTDEQSVVDEFVKQMRGRDYEVEEIKLSNLISLYPMEGTPVQSSPEFGRVRSLQLAGNALRAYYGDEIVARLGCAEVARRRSEGEPDTWEARPKRKAYVFRSLKHPEEAALLRTIYGHGFYLVAIHSAYEDRIRNLTKRKMDRDQAIQLMEFDEKESDTHGQNTRETFELADFYIHGSGDTNNHVERFVDLMFGALYITPTKEEYGMHMAAAAAQRSADLSRQVGAAICDTRGDLIAAGCNEVPKAGGGSYWPNDNPDVRDWTLGQDPNDAEKDRRFERLLQSLEGLGAKATGEQLRKAWAESGLKDITEFGRTVHAEMDVILSCARRGASIQGATLYCTTFPCHNCARHIVASGLMRVVYIEPYAKSEAYALYGDSIVCFAIPTPQTPKPTAQIQVRFDPFEGVAPRRFADFFSMRHLTGKRIERKVEGRIISQDLKDLNTPRMQLSEFAYIKREEFAVNSLARLVSKNVD